MKKRAKIFYRDHRELVRLLLGFAVFGGVYSVFTLLTGWGIPCPVHLLTGWSCPGCGISRFFLALLRLDLPGALSQNLAVAVLLPLWIGVGMVEFWWNPKALEEPSALLRCLELGSVVFLLVFGVLRNLPGFEFLLPS